MKLNLDRCDIPHSMIETIEDGQRLIDTDCRLHVCYLVDGHSWVCAKCATDTLSTENDWMGLRIIDFHLVLKNQTGFCSQCGEKI